MPPSFPPAKGGGRKSCRSKEDLRGHCPTPSASPRAPDIPWIKPKKVHASDTTQLTPAWLLGPPFTLHENITNLIKSAISILVCLPKELPGAFRCCLEYPNHRSGAEFHRFITPFAL